MEKIYKIVLLSICVFLFPFISSASEELDTVLHVKTPVKVIVTEDTSGTLVELKKNGEEDVTVASIFTGYSPDSSVKTKSHEGTNNGWWYNRNLIKQNKCHDKWGLSFDGVCLGLTKAIRQGDNTGIQWSKSFEISWLSCLKIYYEFDRSRISLGFGFNWRNYKITTSDRYLSTNSDRGLIVEYYPENIKGRFSRLKTFSLQLPLLYEYNIPRSSLSLKVGPIVDFNTYASVKSVWDDNGGRKDSFSKNIGIKKVSVDFFATVSFCKTIGLYVRYSPVKVMDVYNSINFNPLTFGFTFGI